MKTKWVLMVALLVLSLIFVSCVPKEATPEAADTPVPTKEVVPTTEPTEEATQESGTDSQPEATVDAAADQGMCEAAPLPVLPISPVTEEDHAKGASAADATLTIVKYSDFQCPGCSGIAPAIELLLEENPGIRLVFRHFPLSFHQNAPLAAEAAEAADAEGKFWGMYELLFANQSEWSGLETDDFRTLLTEYATTLELDVEAFNKALDDGTYTDRVQKDYMEAESLGLPGTPSFVFDNVLFPSDLGLSYQGLMAFKDILDNQDTLFFDAPPEMSIESDGDYEATLKTSKGDIVVRLFADTAPTNVNSFVFLAKEKWYDGANFFFVQDDFVAVTGDPSNSTVGYPGYYCAGETLTSVFDGIGWLGMLQNGQFFITLGADAAQLNGQFSLIGEVTGGEDVLANLTRITPSDVGSEPDVLKSVEIVEK